MVSKILSYTLHVHDYNMVKLNAMYKFILAIRVFVPIPFPLPRYDTTDGSEDSGLVVADSENFAGPNEQSLSQRYKYLHI